MDDVKKRYKQLLMLHPDKCSLPHARDAFELVDAARKKIPDEGVLLRFKQVQQKTEEKEARVREAQAARAAEGQRGGAAGAVSAEELRRKRVEEDLDRIARENEEAEKKRHRREAEQRRRVEQAACIARQQAEWNELMGRT